MIRILKKSFCSKYLTFFLLINFNLLFNDANPAIALTLGSQYAYAAVSPNGTCLFKASINDGKYWSGSMFHLNQNGEQILLWKIPKWYAYPSDIYVSNFCTMAHIRNWNSCEWSKDKACNVGKEDVGISIYGVKNTLQTQIKANVKSYKVIDLLNKTHSMGYSRELFTYFWVEDIKFDDWSICLKTYEKKEYVFSMQTGEMRL